ncbi:DNA-3-methyladenine glycosylase I [Candidatus Neptunochlamydia vexilliferae]|uniref:DNA-3-methyladenine glycosylase I n=1 Tax=Candidatus Neptunichlamydia vexilliferae TaxID=1651774 RepID=A0ABS0AZ33_9BACT|nr:DNA-3-methyladenine glycosylase I [Candidatus Neptunochlamydia vexilliferae]MBF5059381.1 hypothetical protein [Candidatus Neptunochlamydia vexilliferae]
MNRCAWVKEGMETYHDKEWGVPVHSDQLHFELLVLEGMQAGLSWELILKKRAAFQKVFHDFDPSKVAQMTDKELERALHNPNIIRNRKKLFAASHNAKCFLKIQKEFGTFDTYVWPFVGGKPHINHWEKAEEVPCLSPISMKLAADLKKRGMIFVGPKIIYSYMQAAGLVSDHTTDCFAAQPSEM